MSAFVATTTCKGAKLQSSAGGMEDSAHSGTLSSQLIVFSNSLLCLQHRDVHTSLLHKLQRCSWNLVEKTGTINEAFDFKRLNILPNMDGSPAGPRSCLCR